MSTQKQTNRLSAAVIVGLVSLPVVVACAADPEQTSTTDGKGQRTEGARTAILHGRVTNEAGAPLAGARVQVIIRESDRQDVDFGTHKWPEAKSDAKGDYRLELPEITKPTAIYINALKPGYRRSLSTFRSSGPPKAVNVGPGTATEASLTLDDPTLYFKGLVVDEKGKPIPAVQITAQAKSPHAYSYVETTVTDPGGSFELFDYPLEPETFGKDVSKGLVSFFHPDYVAREIEDVYALAPNQRERLRIVLATGHRIAGTLVDVAGNPVPHAMIKAIRSDRSHRKATMTDANGKFTLRGLAQGSTILSARSLDIKQKIRLPITVDSDKDNLPVRLKAMSLPADLKKYAVLGMQLADVTPELQSAYDLHQAHGALILDPGKDSDRLRIGRLAEGYCFFMVGHERIGSVREFVERILAEAAGRTPDLVRVVYTVSRLDFDGTNTQHLRLTKDDVDQLKTAMKQLKTDSK